MNARQYILHLADELVVDLFAGGGGASTGIEQAIGRHVDIAINHGQAMPRPIGTVTTQDHHHLVAAHLKPSALRAVVPDDTERIAESGDAQRVHAWTGTAHASELPGHLTALRPSPDASNRHLPISHHAEVRAFLTAYYGSDQDTPLHDPLHTVTTKPRFGLVMVDGLPYEVADIGMRMLQPRELYRAQGFPDSYRIDRGADGRALSKAAQVRMCGNSVAPPVAAAIVRSNYAERQALSVAA